MAIPTAIRLESIIMNKSTSSPLGQFHAIDSTEPRPARLTYRLDEVAADLGVSRRLIERERAAGRFPQPDVRIGKVPLWTRETLVRWVTEGVGVDEGDRAKERP